MGTALSLRLIDRTGVEIGLGHCRRDRYLTRHAGPHGYGWVRKAQSIPALTGQHVHEPIGAILTEVMRTDAIPDEVFVYAQIRASLDAYDAIVTARGLATVADPLELTLRTNEQKYLLEGLVWCWYWYGLPSFHVEHRLLSVESEELTVHGCTCGLGDGIGTAEDHDARGCQGIGWMTRADVVAEHRVSLAGSYHEFKTTSEASMNWEAQWQHRSQLVAGAVGAERRLEKRIDAAYIHALIKGKNQREWDPVEKKTVGPKYQNSTLVYALRRPANPPLMPEDWAVKREYVDGEGKNRKLGKDYLRTGLWELPEALWKANGAFSPLHYWLQWTGVGREQYRVIGPIYRASAAGVDRVEEFLAQLVGEEQRWTAILWELYEFEAASGQGWGTPEFDAVLNRLVPMNRGDACQSFFGDTCGHLALCNKEPGWQTPDLIGFIQRRPHHIFEARQAEARGLLLPEEGIAETGEGNE